MSNAIKNGGMIARADELLRFGKSGTLSTSEVAFGDSAHTDGILINTGDTDLEGMNVYIKVNTAPTASGSPTAIAVNFMLKGSSDNGSTWTEICSKSLASTALTAGAAFKLPIPAGYADKPLLKLSCQGSLTSGTTPAFTAGEFEAWIDSFAGAI